MNRWIELTWIGGLSIFAVREVYAVIADKETLSRSIWNAERTPYGMALALIMGILLAHFIGKTKAAAIAGLIGVGIGFVMFQF